MNTPNVVCASDILLQEQQNCDAVIARRVDDMTAYLTRIAADPKTAALRGPAKRKLSTAYGRSRFVLDVPKELQPLLEGLNNGFALSPTAIEWMKSSTPGDMVNLEPLPERLEPTRVASGCPDSDIPDWMKREYNCARQAHQGNIHLLKATPLVSDEGSTDTIDQDMLDESGTTPGAVAELVRVLQMKQNPHYGLLKDIPACVTLPD